MTDEPTETTTDHPTILEQFYKKHGADRKRLRLDRFEDAGAKQRLVILVEEDFITPLQARAPGRRRDQCAAGALRTGLAGVAVGSVSA